MIQFIHLHLDANGRATEAHVFEINRDDAVGIVLDGYSPSTTNYVRRTSFTWYDPSGRPTKTADFGPSDGTTSADQWQFTEVEDRPGTLPT